MGLKEPPIPSPHSLQRKTSVSFAMTKVPGGQREANKDHHGGPCNNLQCPASASCWNGSSVAAVFRKATAFGESIEGFFSALPLF